MARIAGFKAIKNNTGKVTHVTLSMKYHAAILQDMIDLSDTEKARKGNTVEWGAARQKINKKHKLKN